MIKYVTRGGTSPHGKPRVFFTSHPDDFALCFEKLSGDILDLENCAVYYDDKHLSEDLSLDELSEMQLFLIPVTRKFLYSDNYARQKIFKYATENNKPVLPVIMENGIFNDFNSICGGLQTVNYLSTDNTEKPYKERLKEFLNAVLIGDELQDKIREAFDTYIFLSYRKKDRAFAQQLMKLIHKNDFCRDIAIWYDEFLVPGESFNDAIAQALEKSPLFALVVTPSLLEKNNEGKNNYVMETEYPMARKANKRVMPFEMTDTDHSKLEKDFPGINGDSCIDSNEDEKVRKSLLDALHSIALEPGKKDAVHDFFIGLAYLGGIDVEIDHDIAVRLIKSAADSGLVEAVSKLVYMYRYGEGVKRDYDEAIEYQKKKCTLLKDLYRKNPCGDAARDYIISLQDLGDYYLELKKYDQAKFSYDSLCDFCNSIDHLPHESQAGLMIGYDKLSFLFRELGQSIRAGEYIKKNLDLLNRSLERDPKNRDTMIILATSHNNYGRCLMIDNRYMVAKKHFDKALETFTYLDDIDPSPQSRRNLSCTLSYLGNVCTQKGDYTEAMSYFNRMREMNLSLFEELRTNEAELDYAISCFKLATVSKLRGDNTTSIRYLEESLEHSKNVAEKSGTYDAYFGMVTACNVLLDILFDSGNSEAIDKYGKLRLYAAKNMYEICITDQSERELRNSNAFYGEYLRTKGKADESVEYFKEAVSLSEEILKKGEKPEDADKYALNCMTMGLAMGNPDSSYSLEKALFYLKKAFMTWDHLCNSLPPSDPGIQKYSYYRQLATRAMSELFMP